MHLAMHHFLPLPRQPLPRMHLLPLPLPMPLAYVAIYCMHAAQHSPRSTPHPLIQFPLLPLLCA